MGKETAKRVTFDQLIARKSQREQDKLKIVEIYSESMDANLLCHKPSDDVVLEILGEAGEGTDVIAVNNAFKKLIYFCCDALQDTKLHTELQIVDPLDVVQTIFDLRDITELGSQLAKFVGVFDREEEEIDTIKN